MNDPSKHPLLPFEVDCEPVRGVAVKGGGTLWSTATFPDGVTVNNGETLRLTYKIEPEGMRVRVDLVRNIIVYVKNFLKA